MFCRLRCWHYDDPVVEEATNVLREWGVIWNRSFVVSWIQLLFLPLDGRHVVYFSSRKNTNNIKGKKTFLKQAYDVNIISAFFTVKLMRCVTLGAPVYRSVFFCTKNCLFLFSISPKLRLIFIKGHAIVSERKKRRKCWNVLGETTMAAALCNSSRQERERERKKRKRRGRSRQSRRRQSEATWWLEPEPDETNDLCQRWQISERKL